MGTDPFMLSTSIIGVMSQRLIRCLCPHCRETKQATEEELTHILPFLPRCGKDLPNQIEIGHAVGCPLCEMSGYRGRTAIQEIMPVTADVAKAIASRETLDAIREIAVASGYEPMQFSALNLVLNGETTVEEVHRHVFMEAVSDSGRGHLRLAA